MGLFLALNTHIPLEPEHRRARQVLSDEEAKAHGDGDLPLSRIQRLVPGRTCWSRALACSCSSLTSACTRARHFSKRPMFSSLSLSRSRLTWLWAMLICTRSLSRSASRL